MLRLLIFMIYLVELNKTIAEKLVNVIFLLLVLDFECFVIK